MRQWGVLFGTVFWVGCSGQLVIESSQQADPTGCVSSSACGVGSVCRSGQCVASEGRCSARNPDGDCPLGRVCTISGICASDPGFNDPDDPDDTPPDDPVDPIDSVFDCNECAAGELCGADECVSPDDTGKICGDGNLAGACPRSEVCVAGTCTPIVVGKNDCSDVRPNGLCPLGAVCVAGFCLPADERPCSGVAPDGNCPAGQACTGGACAIVSCSDAAPFGACTEERVCLNGTCQPKTALLTCEELDCAGRNRDGCTVGADGIARCGECLPGYFDNGLAECVADSCTSLDCAGQFRTCVAGPPESCGACVDGYREGDFGCEPVRCDDLECNALNRECTDGAPAVPSSCGDCQSGYLDDAGTCRLATCADIGADCAAENRTCEEDGSNGAVCGDCVSGTTVGSNGQCVLCDTGDCTPCLGTSECIARGDGGFCSPVTGLCTLECSSDGDCGANQVCTANNRCAYTAPVGPVCAAGVADQGELVRPLVYLLVDRSSSMNSGFNLDGNTIARWLAVREVLFGNRMTTSCSPGGVLSELDEEIHFGLVTYATSGSPPNRSILLDYANDPTVLPPLDNCDALAADFASQGPTGGTPTGEAFEDLLANILTTRANLEAAGEPVPPTFVILATDGKPESTWCTDSPNATGEWWVVDAARRAFDDYGIKTFALSVGQDIDAEHLQDVANVGAGLVPLAPLALEDYAACGSFSGNNDVLVYYPLNTFDGFTSLPNCADSTGNSSYDCLDPSSRNTFCRSDRMEECVANLRPLAEKYEGVYGVPACTEVTDVDVDLDDTADIAACFVGSDGTLLRNSLDDVFATVGSCLVEFSGSIASGGVFTVWFDDDVLQPGTDWRIVSVNLIEIIGARCDELQDGDPHFVSFEVDNCGEGG